MAAGRQHEHRVAFLRMAAVQLRELANAEPGIGRELRHIADQLEAEASEMEADD